MWRSAGDRLYELVQLLILSVEVVTITVLAVIFALRGPWRPLTPTEQSVLLLAAVLMLLCLGGLTLYILVFHAISKRIERAQQAQYQLWVRRWGSVLLQDGPPPSGPLPPAAEKALIDLRKTLKGESGQKISDLIRSYSLEKRWLKRLNASRPDLRLEALDMLAALALPETLQPVLAQLHDPRRSIRSVAVRAAAHSLAETPNDHAALECFLSALCSADLSESVLEDALFLTGDAARYLLIGLLVMDDLPARLLVATVNVAGQLQLMELSPQIVTHLGDPQPEVRSAVLQTLVRWNYVPQSATEGVLKCIKDPVEAVRVLAVRALALIAEEGAVPLLWTALADPAWLVQRAAAQALLHFGRTGASVLKDAARRHPDQRAAQLAVQCLLNRREFQER
jgi:HEAT repeat protein